MATLSCSKHPGQRAAYRCRSCDMPLCSECVSGASGQHPQCLSCRALVAPLAEEERQVSSGSFLARLPDIARYFANPGIWMVLVALAFFVALLSFFGGLAVAVITTGIEASVFFNIALHSASGSRSLSSDTFDFFDSLLYPFLLYLTAALPLLASLYWAGQSIWISTAPFDWGIETGPKIAIVASLVLYPLLLTIAAISRSLVSVLNPAIWVETLRAFGINYVYGALFFYGLMALEIYVFSRLALEALLAVPSTILGLSLFLLILYVPRAFRYRALGALCEPFMAGPPTPSYQAVAAELAPTPEPEQAPPPAAQDTAAELTRLASGCMEDREILEVARAAAAEGNHRKVYRAVEALWKQHPESSCVTPALWLAAQAQEANGEEAAMKKTLTTLLQRDPEHPLAEAAREKLEA